MCGVVGIVSKNEVASDLYEALTVIQHRGQDAAGIMTYDGSKFHLRKWKGLVREVFKTRHMMRLKGSMGLGHVRYPTAGGSYDPKESQPFYVNSPYGISLIHNGNLTNYIKLSAAVKEENMRHLETNSDSEVLLYGLINEGKEFVNKIKL